LSFLEVKFSKVYLEDLETGDIEDADERGTLALGAVERLVDANDEPPEELLVQGLGEGLDGELHLNREIEKKVTDVERGLTKERPGESILVKTLFLTRPGRFIEKT
jgi:hypothetical protein